MGILDEAIREHLELKRQHGAAESELHELEKDAFGPAERPGGEQPSDQPSEAPTEFMAQPEPGEEPAAETDTEPSAREEAAARIAGLQEPPESPGGDEEEPEASAPEPAEPDDADVEASGPSTEERQVISEQPTEHFDVVAAGDAEAEAGEEPDGIDVAESTEPEAVQAEDDMEDDFFDEKRLSEELDQALEGPSDVAEEVTSPEEPDEAADEAAGQPEPSPPESENLAGEAEAPPAGEPEQPPAATSDEDVLEETPEFLEGSPEDDELWFEQKPPKDFDFDD